MKKYPEQKRNRRAGQTLMLFAVLFVVFAGVLGLVFDGARLMFERRRAQAAADAGAIGGVQELRRGHKDDQSDVTPAALYDAGLHGFASSDVTVYYPPTSGEHQNDDNYVEVVVDKSVPTTFMRMFGPEASSVKARSVAGLKPTGDPCIIVLDPDDSDSFKHNGTPTLTADCGIMVNSNNSSYAMRQNGSGSITSTWVGVTGGFTGSNITPTPHSGVPPMVDPLASLAPPDYSSMSNGNKVTLRVDGENVDFYFPGYYNNTIQITGGKVVFLPGTYVLNKGIKATGGDLWGSGVFFYNINTSGNFHVEIGGNATARLSAPTSGPYKGMLFFVNRNSPDKSPGNKLARGDENSYFSGAIYMPSQHLDFAGNPQNNVHWTVVVSNTLNISGTSDIQVVAKPTSEQAPPAYRTVLWE